MCVSVCMWVSSNVCVIFGVTVCGSMCVSMYTQVRMCACV